MQKFNEWLTKNHSDDLDALKTTDNLGMVTNEDDALVTNQLEQFVDRIAGILHNVAEDKKEVFLSKLITDLQNRI